MCEAHTSHNNCQDFSTIFCDSILTYKQSWKEEKACKEIVYMYQLKIMEFRILLDYRDCTHSLFFLLTGDHHTQLIGKHIPCYTCDPLSRGHHPVSMGRDFVFFIHLAHLGASQQD